MRSFLDADIQAFLRTPKGKKMEKDYNKLIRERKNAQYKLEELDNKMKSKFRDISDYAKEYYRNLKR